MGIKETSSNTNSRFISQTSLSISRDGAAPPFLLGYFFLWGGFGGLLLGPCAHLCSVGDYNSQDASDKAGLALFFSASELREGLM